MFGLQLQCLSQQRDGGLRAMVDAHRHCKVVTGTKVRLVSLRGGAKGPLGGDVVVGPHQGVAQVELIERPLRSE